ncbi:AbrB/MazE/SpoVT family DNA-binding domain-containing protein [Sphingopyxis witflariensis]|uniref:PbsX family transcriptional regulator n=1 Tax=Sphingopyxis witflariensis TaxID=173675 RepID=A0A246JD52_9SPHN|nr:AbrB/MazE/SpoVT family DNA-binding domain-containing protein [Sphingopyxis witflariensis]OWQ90575.1 PbsX family transcriptional regulator [Sphingopyxis witflariensis]
MDILVKKWGNSATIRIPSGLMVAAALNVGQEVEVREEDGRLIIEPVLKPVYTLDELLAGMKPETFHEIIDFGLPVGNEMF